MSATVKMRGTRRKDTVAETNELEPDLKQPAKSNSRSKEKGAVPAPSPNTGGRRLRRRAASQKPKETDCQIINSLARGLKVLSAFGPEDSILSNKDLSVRTGLPKPTISRLTNTLVRLNFLNEDVETTGYRLGGAAVSLGMSATAEVDLGVVARPFLRAFAEEHGVSVELGVRDGLEMRGLSYSQGPQYKPGENVRLSVHARSPIEASAIGYALLAGLSVTERAKLFQKLEQRHGDNWANIRRRIEFAIDDVQRVGYAVSTREYDGTINSAGVPLHPGHSGVPLVLACSAPVTLLPESRIRKTIGPALVALERDIYGAL
jgi:DNA-binding IclR family transcriptional regulator